MIWIASYPRSGNTFFRIVLHEVYGIESSTYHQEDTYPVDNGYDRYSAVKTHLLPHQLEPKDPSIPAVYLIRDGRDAVISIAHQRSDVYAPGSDFYRNLREAIVAAEGSYFGGWSHHVRMWRERASLVIRFEELIRNPIECIERLRPFFDLPEPGTDKVPLFQDLKSRDFQYGSGVTRGLAVRERQQLRKKWFRRGKPGGWKEEMPDELHQLFLELHGEVLKEWGYYHETDLSPCDLPALALGRLRAQKQEPLDAESPARIPLVSTGSGSRNRSSSPRSMPGILIEAWDLTAPYMDGYKRYSMELLRGIRRFYAQNAHDFRMYVYLGDGRITSLFDDSALVPLLEPSAPPMEQAAGYSIFRSISYRMLQRLPPPLALYSWKARQKLVRLLAKGAIDFDLIHLTAPHNYRVFQLSAQRLVTTVRNLAHRRYPSRISRRSKEETETGLALAVKKGSSFIAPSAKVMNELLSGYGIERERIFKVPAACDRERFSPVEDKASAAMVRRKYSIPEKPYFLWVGVNEPSKNLVNVIRAFNGLIGDRPDLDFSLVVTGPEVWKDTNPWMEPPMQSERVIFTGYANEEDLPALYSGAHALCCISRDQGVSMAALEAMSCGTPVIFSKDGGMSEVILQGGLPAAPEDPRDIREQMELSALDGDLRASLASNALKRATIYSRDGMIEKTLDVYRFTLERD